ncbi:MAG: DUF6118 family protein [Rhodospirillaceae bacterium]
MNDTASRNDQFDDPGKAFNDLRSEIYVLRRAVEDWREELKKRQAPDYETHYEKVRTAFSWLTKQLEELKKFPEEAAETIGEEGRTTLEEAKTIVFATLEDAKRELHYAQNMTEKQGGAFRHAMEVWLTRKEQNRWLIRFGAGGLLVGMILFYGLARALPFDGGSYIAASIVGEDRWNAGLELLRKSDLDRWQEVVADHEFMRANRTTFDACRAAAAKSKKDEKCTIIISPARSLTTGESPSSPPPS